MSTPPPLQHIVAGVFIIQWSEDISAEVSAWVIRILPPLLSASGIWATTANINSRPTAVRTEPSITPIGGQKKPPMINRALRMEVI